MKLLLTLAMLLSLNGMLMGQQEVCLSIQNETADTNAGYYYFDIYLSTLSAAAGDLYLATADFRLEFNTASFSSPSLEIVPHPSPYLGIQAGYCELVPATPDNGITDALLRNTYYNLMATALSDSVATINLNMPTASSGNISTGIAVIDDTTLKHRLGRFRLTGYTGGSASLSWRFNGALYTKVFEFDTMSPFAATEVTSSDCMMFPLPLDEIAPAAIEAITRCYPNPATGSFWFEVEVENAEEVLLQLMDLSGRQVAIHRWTATPGHAEEVSLKGLAPGLYVYQFSTESRQKSGKLMVR